MYRTSPAALTRRSLLAGIAGLAGQHVLPSSPVLADLNAPWAVINGEKATAIFIEPRRDSSELGRLKAGTAIRVLAGPNADGWYLVDTGPGSSANPGWVNGVRIAFSQRAQILWDAGLFDGATDSTGWLASLRHGVVVSVEGPPANGFSYVRYGDLAGYTYTSALQETEKPLTDRYGEWWADVNRSTLTVDLMIGTQSVDQFPASMSTETGDGFYSTAIGRYWIYQKVEGLQYTPYAKAYFMYWCGFDSYRFNGFHSWTMDRNGYVLNGGWGNTAGCVATSPEHSAIIYRFLSVNSRIEIHW